MDNTEVICRGNNAVKPHYISVSKFHATKEDPLGQKCDDCKETIKQIDIMQESYK